MTGDYLWDGSGTPDPEVARLEQVLGTLREQGPPPLLRWVPQAPVRPRRFSFWLALGVEAAVAAGFVVLAWAGRSAPAEGLPMTRLAGNPTIAARPMGEAQPLTAGRWLETGATGRVNIDVGDIGRVEIEPDSRVGLVRARPGEHRLRLARGTLSALIWAPPGQFFVETPSSTAVDLGCAYTLTIDDEGAGVVRVSTGWVGFEWRGRESFIPAGAICLTRPGLGPGTPHFENTSEAFRTAIDTIDLRRGTPEFRRAALDRVLAEAAARDVLTLWHLLSRVEPGERDRVFDRLAGFVPPPSGVTREGVRAGERAMLDRWWDELGLGAANWWRVWKQPWREGALDRKAR